MRDILAIVTVMVPAGLWGLFVAWLIIKIAGGK